MSRHYRYRLPHWARQCVITIEKCTLPLLIFQCIRTLIFPNSFDVFILGLLLGIYVAFQLKWI
nr:hypothetical protein [Saliterribacillus persicus]